MIVKISFSIDDPGSIEKAIATLKQYQKDIDANTDKIINEITDIGVETANDIYKQAGQGNGNDKVSVTAVNIDNGKKIVAEGKSVVFNEFGAGASAGQHEWAGKAPVDVSPGAFSRSKEGTGKYAKYGSWHWHKEKFTSIEPSRALFKAMQAMRKELPNKAREVFGK